MRKKKKRRTWGQAPVDQHIVHGSEPNQFPGCLCTFPQWGLCLSSPSRRGLTLTLSVVPCRLWEVGFVWGWVRPYVGNLGLWKSRGDRRGEKGTMETNKNR